MTIAVGRAFKIKKGSVTIASGRTKSLAWSGEPIDITTDDDSGIRTLLGNAIGQEQIDLSFDGVSDAGEFRDIALAPATSKMLTDITIEWPDGETLSGNFFLNSFSENGAYQDAMTFSASLQSSGTWTYVSAAN
ncbi:MAG: hypothetical protein GWM98_15400 [Nitrospinaceae bacterium]|nr:hypothetical protein [Nitrospinaceae bacterium]NIR55610.1 hypothetical protein [Nitrospinaceae bacterium]NIS86044.1 hypothetical protein [Nitrospinaceae bacterium]NIT82887.1 hypothetical protein [Nitrospinaceae bacterium]NIU45092.1 hypothetical protein [Nitrospinaceae bacterium]